jgi:hypothetical protein
VRPHLVVPAAQHGLVGSFASHAVSPERLAELRQVLAGFLARPRKQNPSSAPSAAERERLRALGYIR